MKLLYADLETYNEVPIDHGTYKYASSAEIMLFSYAFDDGSVRCWDLTHDRNMPVDLKQALIDEDVILVFHNAMFDRAVLNAQWWMDDFPLPIKRFFCTMSKAYAHSLPGSLDKLCEVLNIEQDERKLKAGKSLVHLFCKPMPKKSKLRRATRETHPEKWREFVEYAKFDIVSMRAVNRKLPDWNYRGDELTLWHLDQRINDRGFQCDIELAEHAIAATTQQHALLAEATNNQTMGVVQSATQRDALLGYILADYGVDLPDMRADTLERRLEDPEIPEALKELLRVRLQATTTSTSKYKRVIQGANADGRLRGTLQFCGALRTGRWGGRTFQPHNLPRPSLKKQLIDVAIDAIKADAADLVFDNVMEACSSSIRGVIIAPPGKKLVVSDYSNIEGRALAWLAGEEWKLQAFRDFDAGIGKDLYVLAYARAFNIDPEDVDDHMRQIGKVMELALGYGGGVGAFLTMVATYGIDLYEMAERGSDSVPHWAEHQAASNYDWAVEKKRTYGLLSHLWIMCEALKLLWRRAHPMTVKHWSDLNQAAKDAIDSPGKSFQVNRVTLKKQGAWLRMILPSGRSLCYPSARIDGNNVTYMGVNQYSRKWCRIKTYGGKLAENETQAVARDRLAEGMRAVENYGRV
jgi:DNA polymerase